MKTDSIASAPQTAIIDDHSAAPSPNAGNLYILNYLSPDVGKATADVAGVIGIGRSTAQKALTSLEAEGLTRRAPGVREGARRSPDLWFDARVPTTAAEPDDSPLHKQPQEPATEPVQPETTEPQYATSEPDASEAAEPEHGEAETAVPVPAEAAEQEDPARTKDTQPRENATVKVTEPDDAAPAEQPTPPALTPDATPVPGLTAGPDAAAVQEKPKKAPKTASKKSASAATPKPEGTNIPATVRLGHGELRVMVAEVLRAHPERAWTPSAIAKELGGKSAGAVANACEKLLDTMEELKTFDDAPRRYQFTPPVPPKTKKGK